IDFVTEDARELNCVEEISHLREILKRGTSAHQQLRVYNESLAMGKSDADSLKDVVDWLIRETVPRQG
ncbi:MAG: carboxylate-amine ligase, partial [Gammaproteobacteria bacterium]|nr:carboxylate-amine ligase [Gammaproteobacteria bacterium]